MAVEDQHRIVHPGTLLDGNGSLREPGWATSPLLTYNRGAVRASVWRLKEWDYYLVCDDDIGLALTVFGNGIIGLVSAHVIDFRSAKSVSKGDFVVFPLKAYQLPYSSGEGTVEYRGGHNDFLFTVADGERHLRFKMENHIGNKPLTANITLTDEPRDSIVMATPFTQNPKQFYYNQKIIGMKAQGTLKTARGVHVFEPETATGLLDWGRGVWPYESTWYWSSASGYAGGRRFGFNLGYGFGDTSAASENILFVDGVAHKLDRVRFEIPTDDTGAELYEQPWTFTSNDDRLLLDFIPIHDRHDRTKIGPILQDAHQVFGRFTGRVVLDDGLTLKVEKLLGFAEKVHNKW